MATGKAAAVSVEASFKLPKIERNRLIITLVGDSALITHRWSEKAKKEMLDTQMKRAKTSKVAKDPDRDFADSLYWLTTQPSAITSETVAAGRFGFPSVGFKKAAVTAAGDVDGAKMTEMRRRFHVEGEFVEIEGAPIRREDMVRLNGTKADIRFRGMFPEWRATLNIEYNSSAISAEQIVNLFNLAGFGVGIGEWRPEKNGQFGRFHVATDRDMKAAS